MRADERASCDIIYAICQDVDAFKRFQDENPGFAVATSDNDAAGAIAAWAHQEAAAGYDGDDDYYRDLVRILDVDEVPGRSFALVCSAVPAFCERDRRRASSYIGTIGERPVLVLRLTQVGSFAGRRKQFGVTHRLGFEAHDGSAVVWFSSRAAGDLGFAVDGTYVIKATVRRHDVYRGFKHTVISRGIVLTPAPETVLSGPSS